MIYTITEAPSALGFCVGEAHSCAHWDASGLQVPDCSSGDGQRNTSVPCFFKIPLPEMGVTLAPLIHSTLHLPRGAARATKPARSPRQSAQPRLTHSPAHTSHVHSISQFGSELLRGDRAGGETPQNPSLQQPRGETLKGRAYGGQRTEQPPQGRSTSFFAWPLRHV